MGWLISPAQIRVEFTTPPACNSAIQAVVRTRSEVQNGSSTKTIRKFAVAGEAWDM